MTEFRFRYKDEVYLASTGRKEKNLGLPSQCLSAGGFLGEGLAKDLLGITL